MTQTRKNQCEHLCQDVWRCVLTAGHKGRHTTVGFQCDDCGRWRRGAPRLSNEDIVICFMCSRGIYPKRPLTETPGFVEVKR